MISDMVAWASVQMTKICSNDVMWLADVLPKLDFGAVVPDPHQGLHVPLQWLSAKSEKPWAHRRISDAIVLTSFSATYRNRVQQARQGCQDRGAANEARRL